MSFIKHSTIFKSPASNYLASFALEIQTYENEFKRDGKVQEIVEIYNKIEKLVSEAQKEMIYLKKEGAI